MYMHPSGPTFCATGMNQASLATRKSPPGPTPHALPCCWEENSLTLSASDGITEDPVIPSLALRVSKPPVARPAPPAPFFGTDEAGRRPGLAKYVEPSLASSSQLIAPP